MVDKAFQGKLWEGEIEAVLTGHRELYWHRNHPPTRYVKQGNMLRAVPSGEGPPDFMVLVRGRLFEFEAKSFTGKRWPFDKLTEHQANALDKVSAAGGGAGIFLAQYDEGKRIAAWWLPWARVGPLWHRWHLGFAQTGEGSLTPYGADLNGAPLHRMGQLVDLLLDTPTP